MKPIGGKHRAHVPIFAVWFLVAPTPAWTALQYNAAGDATEGSVILWTRTFDSDTGHGIHTDLVAQVALDPLFETILYTFSGENNPIATTS